jgi:hypothetical protein
MVYVINPMIIGTIIYLISRSNSIFFLKILNLKLTKVEITHWVKYNLVDGLWAFSISALIQIIWNWRLNVQSILWNFAVVIIALYLEFYFGTFDFVDLIFLSLGLFLPILISLYNTIKNKNHEQEFI